MRTIHASRPVSLEAIGPQASSVSVVVLVIHYFLVRRPAEADLDEYHPKATRTLFIGNLEKDVSVTDLRNTFSKFGEIIVSILSLCVYHIRGVIIFTTPG